MKRVTQPLDFDLPDPDAIRRNSRPSLGQGVTDPICCFLKTN